jgi:hypothetical protein
MNFIHPFQILKAEPAKGEDKIKIVIKASTEGEDREGERILKSAFEDHAMQTSFLKEGYYDYNHLSDILDERMRGATGKELVELQKAKTEAIIGYPESLEIRPDGVYSTGYLIASNSFVQQIRKGLEAGWKGWGASISGYTVKGNVEGKKIKSLVLRKIAIAPLQEAINPETSVMLAKSVLLRDIFKSENFSTDSQERAILSGEMDEATLQELKLKTDLTYRFMLNHPDFQAEVASDVVSVLKSQAVGLGHNEIAAYVRGKYAFDQEAASKFADAILLTYNS